MNIKLITALDVRDGYGFIGQNMALALDKLGHNVQVEPVKIWYSKEQLKPRINDLIKNQIKPDFTLIIMYPVYDFGKINGDAAILTMYEADKCPNIWTKKINSLKMPLYAPSGFVANMFKESGVKVPIEVLTLGVDSEVYSKKLRTYPEDRPFRFLTIGKMEPRKNLEFLVDCFREAFDGGEDVELIVKTREKFLSSYVKKAIKEDFRIKPIEKTVTEEELLKLYYYCDVFVYPSRGEGFSFPPRNAVATGMPTMVTRWSALAEIPGIIPLPVVKLSPMFPCGFSYGDHDKMLMAEVDSDYLISYMRDLFSEPYTYNMWAKDTYEVKQDTWEDCANNFIKSIQKEVPKC